MNLTNEEGRLVFDHFFHCTEQEQIHRSFLLITSNPLATDFYFCLQQTLAQLEHIKDEQCPTELVEKTITRLKLATVRH